MDRSSCDARKHGTATAYTAARCRCPDAREAWRLYNKRLREGRIPRTVRSIDGTGTRRRLRALAALGHSLSTSIAPRLGVDRSAVHRWHTAERVAPSTVRAVKRLYAELSMTPGGNSWTAAYARAHGWHPPLAWDDDTIDDPRARPILATAHVGGRYVDHAAVERLVAGDHPDPANARPGDRRAAAAVLYAAGMYVEDIAERLGVSVRNAERYRPPNPARVSVAA